MKKFITLICARGGSKGIKNKNLLKIGKKSLIRISIEHAKQIKSIKDIYVSTDSKKIAAEAIKYGAKVPFLRPKKLAKDNTPEIYVWRHFINFLNKKIKLNPDYIISLPVTSPLRKVNDVKKCINKVLKEDLDILFTATKSSRNPYFNIIEQKNNKIKTAITIKGKKYYRRQDAPQCYDLTTVCYIFKPLYVLKNKNLFSGKASFQEISKEYSLDIDDKFDYKLARLLF